VHVLLDWVGSAKHRRKDLVAVAQRAVAIAVEQGRPEQYAELLDEARVVERVEPLEPPLDLLFAAREVEGDDDGHGGRDHRTGNGDDQASSPAAGTHRTGRSVQEEMDDHENDDGNTEKPAENVLAHESLQSGFCRASSVDRRTAGP
jgi:hypothetical protein